MADERMWQRRTWYVLMQFNERLHVYTIHERCEYQAINNKKCVSWRFFFLCLSYLHRQNFQRYSDIFFLFGLMQCFCFVWAFFIYRQSAPLLREFTSKIAILDASFIRGGLQYALALHVEIYVRTMSVRLEGKQPNVCALKHNVCSRCGSSRDVCFATLRRWF